MSKVSHRKSSVRSSIWLCRIARRGWCVGPDPCRSYRAWLDRGAEAGAINLGILAELFRLRTRRAGPLVWLALLLACLNFSTLPTTAQPAITNAAAYMFSTLAGSSG